MENTETAKRKPLLNSVELISHMKKKGIQFNYKNENEAKEFLEKNNNYYKLTSYRKNFDKHKDGENKGKYIDLDFSYLVDLSIIDMRLRYLLLKMCLDIEHFIKVRLLDLISNNPKEDGYNIVEEYISSLDGADQNRLIKGIISKIGNPYCGELLNKYGINEDTKEIKNFPIWSFMEIISFGSLRSLYEFYHNYYHITDESDIVFILQTVNQVRNAAAHNNCMINNLNLDKPDCIKCGEASYYVKTFLSDAGIGKKSRVTKMKNPRLKQIASTIYVFEKIVTSEKTKEQHYRKLHKLVNGRMLLNQQYYIKNSKINSTFDFLQKITNYLVEYHDVTIDR